jgi:hypothetical protein
MDRAGPLWDLSHASDRLRRSAAGSDTATRRPSMSHRVRTVIGTIGILIGFVVVIGFVVLTVFYLHR